MFTAKIRGSGFYAYSTNSFNVVSVLIEIVNIILYAHNILLLVTLALVVQTTLVNFSPKVI